MSFICPCLRTYSRMNALTACDAVVSWFSQAYLNAFSRSSSTLAVNIFVFVFGSVIVTTPFSLLVIHLTFSLFLSSVVLVYDCVIIVI